MFVAKLQLNINIKPMLDNSVLIDFLLSKSKLNQYLQEAFEDYHHHKINAGDFVITLKKSNDKSLSINARMKSIFAEVPIAFTFAKSAGLFSIEGEGSIKINLEIQCEIDETFGFKTKSIMHNHSWYEGPVLHLGELSIPAETISNCVIAYMKESLLEKLDKRLEETADIKKMINEQLKLYATNYLVNRKPDLYFNGQLTEVQSSLFREDETDIHLDLWLEMSAKISDEPIAFEVQSTPVFFWAEDKKVKNSQKIDIELSYVGLAKLLMTEINGQEIGGKTFELNSIHIRNTSQLEIKAHVIEPIAGIITFTGMPYLAQAEQKIYLDNLDIDIDANNFIYKLSSPIIEKILRNQIIKLIPFDPLPHFKGYMTKIPQIQLYNNRISLIPSFSAFKIEHLQFGDKSLVCTLGLDDAELDVVV